MKLIDLLSVVTEYTNIKVFVGTEKVAEYDGKNSIDDRFHDKEIVEVSVPSQYVTERELWIEIKEE